MLSQSDRSQHLPIQHPAYQYPPSINPYWSKIQNSQGLIFLDNQTESHAGQWRKSIQSKSPLAPKELHVEIGCNGGHVILEWAKQNPQNAYIGIDWKFKQIHRGFEKAAKRDIRNLAFLRAHALRLGYMFSPGEIDHLYLLFPDPWPKKSQLNNRLVSPEWLKIAAQAVRVGGHFEIRTDHRGYFDWIREAVSKVPEFWQVEAESENLYETHPDPRSLQIPQVTLFERLFIKDGLPVHRLHLRRKD